MLDSDQISAVTRSLGTRTLEAGEAHVATITRTYGTDLHDLWEACTSAERIARWLLPVTGELRLGGRYQLEGNAGGVVERCDPPHGFAATWEFGGGLSWITLRLTAVDAGHTRFELEHVAHVDDAMWAEYGPGATGIGWDISLLCLHRHLADPAADRLDEAAWAATDEGRRFMTGSGDSWCAADVAAGADATLARAAADRTITAFTATGS